MPHILKPDIPDSQYFEIVKFVTHCIAGSPEEVVGGKQLTQSYLEQYLDKNRLEDEVYVTTEKRLIIQTIRYMASENILKAAPRDSGTGFIIHPLCAVANLWNKLLPRSSEAFGVNGHNEQSCRKEKDGHQDSPDDLQEAEGTGSIDPEAHANAYAEMTKMAIPMRTEPQFRTPSKKRQRVEEIDDSYTSSRIGSSSPILNPGRSPKRIVLPDDMRRRSDPGFISPYKANTPRRRRLEEDFSAISLKQEQQNSFLTWLDQVIENLHLQYPNDRFIADDEDIKCLDCNRTITVGRSKRISRFEQHLKGNRHKDIVADRRREPMKCSIDDLAYDSGKSFVNQTQMPSVIQCFSLPNVQVNGSSAKVERPIQVMRDILTTMSHCLNTVENDSMAQSERLKMMEERAAATEIQFQQRFEDMRELIAVSEDRSKRQCDDLDKHFTTSEARNRVQSAQLADMDQRLGEFDATNQQHLEQLTESLGRSKRETNGRMQQLEENVATSNTANKDELERMAGQLALSVQRNIEQFDQMKERLQSLKEENEKKDESMHELEASVQLHSEQLTRQLDREEELRKRFSAQMGALSRQTSERIQAMQKANEERIRLLEKQSAERIRALESSTAEKFRAVEIVAAERISLLEEDNVRQITRTKQCEEIFPVIFKEINDLMDAIAEIEVSHSRRRSSMPRARRRKLRVRPSRRVSSASSSQA